MKKPLSCCLFVVLLVAGAAVFGYFRLPDDYEIERRLEIDADPAAVYAVVFSPDGSRIVTGSEDRTLRIWDPEALCEILRLRGHENYVYDVEFHPAGTQVLSASGDHTVRVWDLRQGTEVRVLKHGAAVHSVGLSALGNVLLAAVGDGHVHAWHLDWEPDDTAGQDWEETARPFLETYQVVSEELARWQPGEAFDEGRFLDACLQLGHQLLLQRRIHSNASVSKVLFRPALRLAENRGLLDLGTPDLATCREAFAVDIRDALRRTEAMASLAASRRAGLIP